METGSHIHYLEIGTPDMDQLCASYTKSLGLSFSESVAELGGARTSSLSNGLLLGIRNPMHDAEEPATRPYYLVNDIEAAIKDAQSQGAEVAVPSMEIPGRGICAIVMHSAVQSGFWQL